MKSLAFKKKKKKTQNTKHTSITIEKKNCLFLAPGKGMTNIKGFKQLTNTTNRINYAN
jgi:hypothetical protein